jgi:hypothetical protein
MRMRIPDAMASPERINPAQGIWTSTKGTTPVAINQIPSNVVPQPFVFLHIMTSLHQQ